ncbi:MAG: sugar phosphate isomerase/epimerase family protein [Planctomycetota bacterium]
MENFSRRDFILQSLGGAAGGFFALAGLSSCSSLKSSSSKLGSKMRFGLVTYQWGKNWDLPTLIQNCETADVHGVELRVQHAHAVDTTLNAGQRKDVKKRFADSPVTLVGFGTNFDFHHVDQAKLRDRIEGAKQYVKLSHDVGSSGVKVKPNSLPDGVPADKTIEQIGKSLNEIGSFAAGYGQQIRVEVHGRKTQQLPVMKQIFDVADHPNVTVCWNSNSQDLAGQGLEYNFNLVKDRLGDTVHVREFNTGNYPYQQLMNLFVKMDYKGWILLEAHTSLPDRPNPLQEQRIIFEQMVAAAQALTA